MKEALKDEFKRIGLETAITFFKGIARACERMEPTENIKEKDKKTDEVAD